jgi:hypothetical protein
MRHTQKAGELSYTTKVGRGIMTLRHIRPGTPDWHDAVEEGLKGSERLTPEEMYKLRQILAMEQTMGMPSPWQQNLRTAHA